MKVAHVFVLNGGGGRFKKYSTCSYVCVFKSEMSTTALDAYVHLIAPTTMTCSE